MASQPIGKLDHIGIAVKSITEARKFFEGILGAHFMYDSDNPGAGFKLCELDLNGLTIEWSPRSYEAFISPKSAHGVLIQIGSGYPTLANDPEWMKSK